MASPLDFTYYLSMEPHLLITSLLYFCVTLGGLLAILLTCRYTLRRMCSTSDLFVPQVGLKNKNALAPCEIAYLLRGGDVSHTLVVLAVDLMQRKLKNTVDEGADLAPYEQSMWEIVTRSLKEWALQKTQETVMAGAKTPIQITRRVMFLYTFVRKSLKNVVGDTIADPRKLKKYFAPSGLIRILADFTSAGCKQAFQDELRKDLLARGLLVPEERRLKIGKLFFAVSILGLVLSTVSLFVFLGIANTQAIVIVITSLVAAFLARAILTLREFLPLYQELALVAQKADRSGWRFKLLKILLNSVNVIFWLGLLATVSVCLAIGFGSLFLIYKQVSVYALYYIIALSITYIVSFDFAFEGWKLLVEETPTPEAEAQLVEMQKTFSQASPLEAFRAVLSSSDYDPTFSRLLALYGIETLLVLI